MAGWLADRDGAFDDELEKYFTSPADALLPTAIAFSHRPYSGDVPSPMSRRRRRPAATSFRARRRRRPLVRRTRLHCTWTAMATMGWARRRDELGLIDCAVAVYGYSRPRHGQGVIGGPAPPLQKPCMTAQSGSVPPAGIAGWGRLRPAHLGVLWGGASSAQLAATAR